MLEIPKSQFSLGPPRESGHAKPKPVITEPSRSVPIIATPKPAPLPKPVPIPPPPLPPPRPLPIPPPIDPRIMAAKQAANAEKIDTAKEKTVYSVGCFYELTKWLIFVAILVALTHFFVATIFIVDGQSMETNFHSGELIIADRWQYLFGKPVRGDTVVLKFPGDPDHAKYIKRVIGLPGDSIIIQNGLVYINGQRLNETYLPTNLKTLPNLNRTLGASDYFMMGDNRSNSSDSRIWGVADKRYLIGKAWIILWPTQYFGRVQNINY